jgi:subtilisin family serine protease
MNLYRTSLLLFLFCSFTSYLVAHDDQKKLQNYIIMSEAADGDDMSDCERAKALHKSILSSVCKDVDSRLIYSYNKATNGFAAKLSDEEVKDLEKHPAVVRAIPANEPYKLLTTHTPDFLQLRGSKGLWERMKNMGEGVIVGVLDTGITPGHPSFNDEGMSRPPAKWKGHCDYNASVCNNKLIGAKSFLRAGADELKHISPLDLDNHGTHTAGTAVGSSVKGINALGIAMGEASGAAPHAHLAVYRVCSQGGCAPPDIIKGIEEAVNDGCDVISLSLGVDGAQPFYLDAVALGGFYAILKGVFVSTAAGNSGPSANTLSNFAPWLLTVAASTTDRQIRSTVKLDSGVELNGESMFQPKNWTSKMLPLVYFGGEGSKIVNASKCMNGTLDSNMVHGKIVLCDRGGNGRAEKGLVVLKAGGAGMILANQEADAFSTNADAHVLPASHVSYVDGLKIKAYIHSTKQPLATFLFKGVALNTPYSPSIASFSSRGPNAVSPLILKPDIAGPGVSILASVPPMPLQGTTATQKFDFMSGTSMATPHLSGIAAIIKKEHPDWSPAAIKSAIMTTADVTDMNGKPIVDETGKPANVFAMGAGQVDPNKALDPGLIYDLTPDEYTRYLCGLGYKDKDVNTIIHPAPPVQCAKVKAITEQQLNYPSIAVSFGEGNTKTITRTLTNVGQAKSTYKAVVTAPKGTTMKVVPSTLNFGSLKEKQSFNIIFEHSGKGPMVPTGELKWVSGNYVVRSPIAISN